MSSAFSKKKKTQSAVSDLVPTYAHRQTTLRPACCELLDNQAGRKAGKAVFCLFLSWNFFYVYVLLVKSGPSRIFYCTGTGNTTSFYLPDRLNPTLSILFIFVVFSQKCDDVPLTNLT